VRQPWVIFAGIVSLTIPLRSAEVMLSGRVVNENSTPVAGARISLRSDTQLLQTTSNPTGGFTLRPRAPGAYTIAAEANGYFQLRERAVSLASGATEITLVLNPLPEAFESVEVTAPAAAIDFSKTAPEGALSGTEILDIPYPTDYSLRNAMRLIPNVVTDPAGGIHINGGAENQVLYTLDDFNITDPLTGRFETRMSVEAVRSIQVSSGGLPAEFGKGSAGTVVVKTQTGDDRFRYSATNFVPAITHRKSTFVQDWTPRVNFSGPLRKGRAWFSDSIDAQYFQSVIDELPKGKDRDSSWRVNNLLYTRVNLTASNILSAGYLASFWTAPQSGLSALDPIETTADRRSRQTFLYAKDQVYFGHGALIEFGFAENRTFGREIPEGHGLFLLTPDGKRGNYFVDAARRAHRDQWIANAFLPSFTALGTHLVKIGTDLDRLGYWQDAHRSGYENFRADGTLLNRVIFGGAGRFSKSNVEASSYVQDSWKMHPKLLVEIGVRQDWDEILGNTSVSPRAGVAWAPRADTTKISASYAIVTDAINLAAFTRPLDEYSLFTSFRHDGTISGGPALTLFSFGPRRHLATPRYQNRGAAVEQHLPANLYARINFLSRRGQDGFTYVNAVAEVAVPVATVQVTGATRVDGVFELRNLRRDVFDSVEITVRQPFRQQYEWMASYTRSRAFSNAVVDLSIDEPMRIFNNFGRMPWDSPNRLLSWGLLPTTRKNWALAYMIDCRDGFPFSIYDGEGRQVGNLNGFRYPIFFEMNLGLERRFVFRGNRWAGRIGSNNITDHKNANVVNNNTASTHFLTFYGGQRRTLEFRLRWLGKAGPRP
jgi:hypothetical protein